MKIPPTVNITVVPRIEWTHMAPPPGSGSTQCCGRTPFDLPRWHRMTTDPLLVTCPLSADLPPYEDADPEANWWDDRTAGSNA